MPINEDHLRAPTPEAVDAAVSPPSGSYSAALRYGDLVFVAGQGPFDPRSGDVVGDSIEEQTHACLQNVERLLVAAGGDLSGVLKTTVYLSDFAYFERYDAVYGSYFSDPRPVRTTVAAGLGGILIEIDAIAALTDGMRVP